MDFIRRSERVCAWYFHWPSLAPGDNRISAVADAQKKELLFALRTNCLHLVGPIYFGREVRAYWPECYVLDMLGILKGLGKGIYSSQVTLEIDIQHIRKYAFKRLHSAGVNRLNIVADGNHRDVLGLIRAGCQYVTATGYFKGRISLELFHGRSAVVSVLAGQLLQDGITHLTVWPATGEHLLVHQALNPMLFFPYERYHFSWGKDSSAYMQHMWDQKRLIGIGPGAESMIDRQRKKNCTAIEDYLAQFCGNIPAATVVTMSDIEYANEYIMLNAGRSGGASLARCYALANHKKQKRLLQQLQYWKARDILWLRSQRFGFHPVSENMYQTVLSEILFDTV